MLKYFTAPTTLTYVVFLGGACECSFLCDVKMVFLLDVVWVLFKAFWVPDTSFDLPSTVVRKVNGVGGLPGYGYYLRHDGNLLWGKVELRILGFRKDLCLSAVDAADADLDVVFLASGSEELFYCRWGKGRPHGCV